MENKGRVFAGGLLRGSLMLPVLQPFLRYKVDLLETTIVYDDTIFMELVIRKFEVVSCD